MLVTMLPMMEFDQLPPSNFVIQMRRWFIASLVLLAIITVGKFIISDYWNALSLILIVIMGLLVLTGEHGVSMSNALFYSVMALISGIFDVISCVVYFQHSKYKPFESGAPTLVLFAQIIFIVSPIVLFISAAIAYSIFSDCQQRSEELFAVHRGPAFDDFGPYGIRDPPHQRPPPQQQRPPAQGGQNRDRQQWQAFQGQGHTLGS